jgi:hypothetical protein
VGDPGSQLLFYAMAPATECTTVVKELAAQLVTCTGREGLVAHMMTGLRLRTQTHTVHDATFLAPPPPSLGSS